MRECFGRLVYTHKTHEKMADICNTNLTYAKYFQIFISGITAVGAISILFTDQKSLKIGTAVISILSLWLSSYLKGFDPGGTAQRHRDTAASLWPIRESYLSLLTDLRMQSISEAEAGKMRDELQRKVAIIYKAAPQTTSKAYAQAQVALKDNEEYTFSDAEIDCFVPSSLRKPKP